MGGAHFDRHTAVARRVLDRIIDQIDQHLVQAVAIARGQHHVVGITGLQRHAPALGPLAHQLDRLVGDAPDLERLESERRKSAFKIGKRDQVVDQPREATRLTLDDAEETMLGIAVSTPATRVSA